MKIVKPVLRYTVIRGCHRSATTVKKVGAQRGKELVHGGRLKLRLTPILDPFNCKDCYMAKQRKLKKIPYNKTFKIKLFVKLHSVVCHSENNLRCSSSDRRAYFRSHQHFGYRGRVSSRFANKYTLHCWL